MDASDEQVPPPDRTPDQLIGLIGGRLDRLRRRRRTQVRAALAIGTIIVVLWAVLLAVPHGTGPSVAVRTAAPATSTTAPTAAAPASPMTTTAPTPTTVPLPPATVPVPPSSTPPPPLARPAKTTVPSPPSSSSTTTVPSPSPCHPGDVTLTASADKTSYHSGEPIVVAATATNTSRHGCFPVSQWSASLNDPAGKNLQAQGVAVDFASPVPAWKPGETQSRTFTFTGSACTTPCMPSVPGTYTVIIAADQFSTKLSLTVA